MLADENFWNVVKYLTTLKEKTDIQFILDELSLNQTQLYSYLNFLKDVGMPIEIYETPKAKLLEVSYAQKEINVKFNLFEWLCFQATFPTLANLEQQPYFEQLKNKLTSLEEQNKEHDLFPALETFASKVQSYTPHVVASDACLSNEIVSFLEEAILEKEVINLKLINQTHSIKLYPRKIVFLDGKLNIVAEGIEDKCLTNISIESIQSAHDAQVDWTPMFSALEIDDFIASIRAITENEVRIVLKVYSREKFNTDLKHHHFGNQCMFTNPEGDHIWAASIEPSDELYDWLSELGKDIEILDPISLKKDLLKYCEEKLKKIA
tara:strand:- start:153667 stop:154632 length:966 start_codon:yes stop_codon:yes gene_type:complete